MQVIPPDFATASRSGHPVLDAIANELEASLAEVVEEPIPRSLAQLLLQLDQELADPYDGGAHDS
jgi:hypothetical protein